jgi:hypothetical protein
MLVNYFFMDLLSIGFLNERHATCRNIEPRILFVLLLTTLNALLTGIEIIHSSERYYAKMKMRGDYPGEEKFILNQCFL